MEKTTILVIDDEQDILTLMCDFLEAKGYAVITADSGADGISLAKSSNPDLIILDISMPDIDGGQVAEELKQTPATQDTPIIFLTGLLAKDNEEDNRHLVGGNIMFAKPCNFEKMVQQIEQLLGVSAA